MKWTTNCTKIGIMSLYSSMEKEMEPTPVFLPRESHGQRSLVGYGPWGRTESDTTEVGHYFQSNSLKIVHFLVALSTGRGSVV